MNVKEVELMGMPKLKKCVLMGGLKNVKSVKMENAGKFESVKGLKEVMEEERRRKEEEERRKREEERKRIEEEERKKREAERKRREEAERKRIEEERKREEAERKRGREEKRNGREKKERGGKEEERRSGEEKEGRGRKKEKRGSRERKEEERKREEMIALAKTTVNVRNVGDLKNASCYVGVITIASCCCNCGELSVLDLSRFVNLRELEVGISCFENVNEVKLIGLNQLERVVIGENCFTKCKCERPWYDPNRHFYLKDCERLKELKIGYHSFCDYSVCEIENVPSLEVIEMGELNEESCNFCYASLELKSDSERMK